MGIQDREYYWEKHGKASQSGQPHANNPWLQRQTSSSASKKKTTGRKPRRSVVSSLLYPILAFVAIWYGTDSFLRSQASRSVIAPAPIATSFISDGTRTQTIPPARSRYESEYAPKFQNIVLRRDRQGHFRGAMLINDVPMRFMIDTGATVTVIPAQLASMANLPVGRYVTSNTAGGIVVDRETTIERLQFGNVVIQDLRAHINASIDEVLIGMNALRYFRMDLNGDTLTLAVHRE